ncbi:MAG: YlxR family protein [Chloroflexota bacterium]
MKHVPQRTCVGCRTVLSKRALTRVVRQPGGVQIDPTGKLPGRGAYLHSVRSCWEQALKGGLSNALKVALTEADRQLLSDFMASLPDEAAEEAALEA